MSEETPTPTDATATAAATANATVPAPVDAAAGVAAAEEAPLPVVHVMTGLPASGKTTAARALQAEAGGRMRRVNLDDLRSCSTCRTPRAAAASRTSRRYWPSRTRRSALRSTAVSTWSSTTPT
ncbi:AAA family ATPase [Streptomyces avidinii]